MPGQILAPDETPAVAVERATGRGPMVVACEHASNLFPKSLDHLGLGPELRDSHYAWDPGALQLARLISEAFDAPLVAARYSRLVYDVNRAPEAETAIRRRCDQGAIPGNQDLDDAARGQRVAEFYTPFRAALKETLDAAQARGPATLVTVHSFTRVYGGHPRAVELGLLHDEDARLVDAMLPRAEATTGLKTARNEPYGPEDDVTHTLIVDAAPRGLPTVMLELRNDLLAEPARLKNIADALIGLLADGLSALGVATNASTDADADADARRA